MMKIHTGLTWVLHQGDRMQFGVRKVGELLAPLEKNGS